MSKSYQDWCVDTLTDILCNLNQYSGGVKGDSYKYVISALVDHYASLYQVTGDGYNDCQINLWNDWLMKCDKDLFFSSVLMSRQARLDIQNAVNAEEIKAQIHFEHIVPRSRVEKQLLATVGMKRPAVEDSVRHILRHAKIVVITEGEKAYLDGEGARITQGDLKFLETHFSELSDEIDEARKCVGKYPKSIGTALVRLAVLARHIGVDGFCMLNGKKLKPKDWLSYLESPNVIQGNLKGKLKRKHR